MRGTRALIHTGNLRNNLRLIRKITGEKRKICLAVKADAYGHGAVQTAQVALEEGVETFGVATVDEGAELRKSGITNPILLFSLPLPREIPELLSLNLSPFVADSEYILLLEKEAGRQQKRLGVHLKVDTGMGRLGCRPDEALELCRTIHRSEHLFMEGLCTHFPGADTGEDTFTRNQIQAFNTLVQEIRSAGLPTGAVHAANSAAILRFPEAHYDMVRPGIAAYGYPPVEGDTSELSFRPVMELESSLMFLKTVSQDFPVSYGMTYRTDRKTVIATVAAGYADGYNRLLSNRGRVSIAGRLYPVAGRICMDQFMVDLGPDSGARRFEKVVLFGPGPGGPDAQDVADLTGSIPYEVTCAVSKRVPRIYLE